MPEPDELIAEWMRRGESIAAYVTANVPADTVPVVVFDHAIGVESA